MILYDVMMMMMMAIPIPIPIIVVIIDSLIIDQSIYNTNTNKKRIDALHYYIRSYSKELTIFLLL